MLAINEVSQRGAEVISQRDAVLTIQYGDADEMILANCAHAIMFVRIRTYAGDRFEAERCPGGAPWCVRSKSGNGTVSHKEAASSTVLHSVQDAPTLDARLTENNDAGCSVEVAPCGSGYSLVNVQQ